MVRVLRSSFGYAVSSLSTVVLPSPCRLCGHLLARFTLVPVCHSCWLRLREEYAPRSGAESLISAIKTCTRCGEFFLAEEGLDSRVTRCRVCRLAGPPFMQAVAFGTYGGPLRELLHLLKYERMEPIAAPLAALLAERVLAMPDLPPRLLVVPVPMHSKHRNQRGIDHAERLAAALTRSLRRQRGKEQACEYARGLVRSRATETQAGLNPHERRANLRGAFFVPPGRATAVVKGRDVLLVDDIYTTGATARACTLALMQAGAASVRVATVGRAQKPEWLLRTEEWTAGDLELQEWELQQRERLEQEGEAWDESAALDAAFESARADGPDAAHDAPEAAHAGPGLLKERPFEELPQKLSMEQDVAFWADQDTASSVEARTNIVERPNRYER